MLPQLLGSWLVIQAAVLHSPRDLRICLLIGSTGFVDAWRWIRWLPHCRPLVQEKTIFVGADEVSRSRRIAELTSLIESRCAHPPEAPRSDPDILVVLDGARILRSVPGMTTVLRDGPAVGIHVICLEADVRDLPPECRAVVEQDGDELLMRQDRSAVIRHVCPDLIGLTGRPGLTDHAGAPTVDAAGLASAADWCESVARALAPLRDAGDDDSESLPSAVRLLDILGADPPTPKVIQDFWSSVPQPPRGTASRAVPAGIGEGGRFTIDLSRDGPHGLVAGTTGAGKSELLQTIIAAHAVMYRPNEMIFVLVDYKGGSAFAECAALPHTVGMVTDLDPHLVRRALSSLTAELRRRERMLAAAGAKDLDAFRRLLPHPIGRPTIPRLLLVVDEFATLARELPEFVAGLVNLAQRGRSLGIHLLLATQRPAGVVSPEIRANTNLRIALRVTDAAESEDVVGCPDAALISPATPGRAVVRTGPGITTAVQTGWIGGPDPVTRPGGDGSSGIPAPRVTPLPWPEPGDAPRRDADTSQAVPAPSYGPPSEDVSLAEPRTDLAALVSAVREASARLGIPPIPSPWLPPLPERITLDALVGAAAGRTDPSDHTSPSDHTIAADGDGHHPADSSGRPGLHADGLVRLPPVAIGLSDHCDRQLQLPFTIDLEHGGHLMIVGSPRTGRSTVLRTAAGALATALPVGELHLYGLDCGGNALAPLADLPHSGAVVSRDDPERVTRLLARLANEISERQTILSRKGFMDLAEARRSWRPSPGDAGDAMRPSPYLVLLVDRFEGFLAAFEDVDGGILVDQLLRLLREGQAVGLRVIITTDRRGLIGRLASLVDERLLLRMADPSDYALAGLSPFDMPGTLSAGRGVAVGGRFPSPVETQIALLDADPTGQAQVAALRAVGSRAMSQAGRSVEVSRRPPERFDRRPFRIDALPSLVTSEQMERAPGRSRRSAAAAMRPENRSSLHVPIGIGGDELEIVEVDLDTDGPGFMISGPPRSGRSCVLLTLALSLLTDGARIVALTPRPSPLRSLAHRPDVVAILDGTMNLVEEAGSDGTCRRGGRGRGESAVTPETRRTDTIRSLTDLPTGLSGDEPLVVLVDDAELVGERAAAELAAFWQAARDGGGGVLIVAGTTEELLGQYRGFLVDVRRGGYGLLLAPGRPSDGELLGVRLSRTIGGPAPPGRGVLVRRGAVLPVQVACPPTSDLLASPSARVPRGTMPCEP
ncbi:FtsK/SpoIIIE domain-containing protein [Frankia sp. CcWB3]